MLSLSGAWRLLKMSIIRFSSFGAFPVLWLLGISITVVGRKEFSKKPNLSDEVVSCKMCTSQFSMPSRIFFVNLIWYPFLQQDPPVRNTSEVNTHIKTWDMVSEFRKFINFPTKPGYARANEELRRIRLRLHFFTYIKFLYPNYRDIIIYCPYKFSRAFNLN